MDTHESFPGRLTVSEWLRYRRLYRALLENAVRRREPLGREARAVLKDEARRAARAVS